MTIPVVSDRQVVRRVLDGDSQAYRFLVERYLPGLVSHLYNLIGDRSMAEDLAQDAFIQAYQKLDQYKSEYAFSTWLYKIADNMTYRQLKQSKKILPLTFIDELPDDKTPTADLLDQRAEQLKIRRAIQGLEPNYQRVITLYYWDNFSYQEIASIMDKPIGTVRTWLSRAKEKLGKELYGQTR